MKQNWFLNRLENVINKPICCGTVKTQNLTKDVQDKEDWYIYLLLYYMPTVTTTLLSSVSSMNSFLRDGITISCNFYGSLIFSFCE